MNKGKLSVKAVTDLASNHLKKSGIEGSTGEARLLISLATGMSRERIIGYPESHLRNSELEKLKKFLKLRCNRKPMSQIVGLREFWSLDFLVDEDVLDPRPDSETLVKTVLDFFPDRKAKLKILDLGTGSGCLLLSLLNEFQNAVGIGTEINTKSCLVAVENSRRLGLSSRASFVICDWYKGLEKKFDIILANPPYLTDQEMVNLEPEVFKFEPHRALSGGFDGLDSYKKIMPHVHKFLSEKGILFLEISPKLASKIRTILKENQLRPLVAKRDLSGQLRCFAATRI